MTTVFTPTARASSSVMPARPRSAPQPGRRIWPSAFSGRQSRMPMAARSWQMLQVFGIQSNFE
jgi:hypothetical protein